MRFFFCCQITREYDLSTGPDSGYMRRSGKENSLATVSIAGYFFYRWIRTGKIGQAQWFLHKQQFYN